MGISNEALQQWLKADRERGKQPPIETGVRFRNTDILLRPRKPMSPEREALLLKQWHAFVEARFF